MVSVYLASMLAMTALGAVVLLWILRSRDWADYSPKLEPPDEDLLSHLAGSVRVWIALFALLGLGAAVGTVAVLEGASVGMMLAGFGVLVLGFLILGTYAAGRSRGQPHSHAVALSVTVLLAVLVLGVVGWLTTEFAPV